MGVGATAVEQQGRVAANRSAFPTQTKRTCTPLCKHRGRGDARVRVCAQALATSLPPLAQHTATPMNAPRAGAEHPQPHCCHTRHDRVAFCARTNQIVFAAKCRNAKTGVTYLGQKAWLGHGACAKQHTWPKIRTTGPLAHYTSASASASVNFMSDALAEFLLVVAQACSSSLPVPLAVKAPQPEAPSSSREPRALDHYQWP